MKRPVFCVALAYALGEVIGLYTRTVGEIGIACVMLVCVGVFMRKMRQGKSACVLGLGVGLGMLGAFCVFRRIYGKSRIFGRKTVTIL